MRSISGRLTDVSSSVIAAAAQSAGFATERVIPVLSIVDASAHMWLYVWQASRAFILGTTLPCDPRCIKRHFCVGDGGSMPSQTEDPHCGREHDRTVARGPDHRGGQAYSLDPGTCARRLGPRWECRLPRMRLVTAGICLRQRERQLRAERYPPSQHQHTQTFGTYSKLSAGPSGTEHRTHHDAETEDEPID